MDLSQKTEFYLLHINMSFIMEEYAMVYYKYKLMDDDNMISICVPAEDLTVQSLKQLLFFCIDYLFTSKIALKSQNDIFSWFYVNLI